MMVNVMNLVISIKRIIVVTKVYCLQEGNKICSWYSASVSVHDIQTVKLKTYKQV